MNPLTCYINAAVGLETKLSLLLAALGTACARNPKKTVAAWFLVVFGMMAGFTQFNLKSSALDLWVDQNSVAMGHNDYLQTVFEDQDRQTLAFNLVLVRDREDNTKNVATVSHFDEIWDLHEAILALEDPDSGTTIADSCFKADGACVYPGVLQFWSFNRTLYESEITTDDELQLKLAQEFYPSFLKVDRGTDFPGYEISDTGRLTTTAVLWNYLQIIPDDDSTEAFAWQSLLVDKVTEISADDLTTIVAYGQADNSVDDELSASVGNDIVLMIIAFNAMIIFVTVVLGRITNKLESRTTLATQTVGMVFVSAGGGYGFAMLCQIPFTTLAQILPFILLGIGVDDALVLTAAFDRTPRTLPIEERVRTTMMREGVSITITSFTDAVALLLGSTTALPAISWFCFYAALSIFFIYGSFVTMFIALLTFDEQRRQRNAPDSLCVRPFVKKADKTEGFDYLSSARARTVDDALGDFLADKFAPVVLHPVVRVIVLIVFTAMAGLGAYGSTLITTEFDLADLVNDSSPVKAYLDEAKDAFSGSPFPPVTARVYVDDEYPVWTFAGQTEMARVLELYRTDSSVDTDLAGDVSYWHDDFTAWAVINHPTELDPDTSTFLVAADAAAYGARVKEWFDTPPFDQIYNGTVYFSETTTALRLASVDLPHSSALVSTEDQAAAVRRIEAITDSNAYAPHMFVYSQAYLFFDQYAIIVREAITTMGLATAAIGVVSLFVLVHPLSTAFVALCLGMILVDLIGSFQLWGLDLNSISVVNLVLSIGLVVDPIVHIMHSFGTQPASMSRREKMVETYRDIGSAVALGIASTILGILPIAFASSQVFRVFFQILFTTMILGFSHGLIFLPVVLSLVGPSVERPHEKAAAGDDDDKTKLAVAA